MNLRYARLVPVALLAWAVAALTIVMPTAARSVALGLWLIALLAVIGCGLAKEHPTLRMSLVVAVLALAAAGSVATQVAMAMPARAELARLNADGGRAIAVTAVVTGKVKTWRSGEYAVDARAQEVKIGRERFPVNVEVQIAVRPEQVSGQLEIGAVVEASGVAEPSDPGERAAFLIRANRGVQERSPPTGVLALTSDLRAGLVQSASGWPSPGAELVPGLAVGETIIVSEGLDQAMKDASLSHLTAISGANCALVVGGVFGLAALCGASRGVRVLCAGMALAGFVVLVTPEPSVVRAAVMASVAMVALLLGRVGQGLSVLCLSVALAVMSDPWLATSLGFALSVAATGALLILTRPLTRSLSRVLPIWLSLVIAVPLSAQLVTGPILLVLQPSLPTYGVIANILAAPAAPVATVLGLGATLLAPVPILQWAATALTWLPASWIAGIAFTVTGLPGNRMPWAEGGWGIVGLVALTAAVLVTLICRPSTRSRRYVLGVSGSLVAVVGGILVGSFVLSTVAGRWTVPREWASIACDVGQGDAVLVRSAGVVALIDAGPDPDALDACLSRVGITRIDLLVLTHFDSDHVGGTAALMGKVGVVLHGPIAEAEEEQLIISLEDAGARPVQAVAGMRGSLGAAEWKVVWPGAEDRVYEPGNDSSVVVDIRGGGVPSILLLGDLSASPQRSLLASGGLDPPYAVVKVAHHGSADQNAGMYDTLGGAVALIGVGADNDYGHPRAELLEILASDGMAIGRTDQNGLVAVWQEGETVRLWRERGGEDD